MSEKLNLEPLIYLDTREIFTETDDGAGEAILIAVIAGDPCDEATHARGNMLAAAPDLLKACKAAIPSGVCLTNKNIPDDFSVALDCTMGDLRKIAAAIAKATHQ